MIQGCPLSLTLFGLFIDELESFILETIDAKVGGLLHHNWVPFLLLVDEIILISLVVAGIRSLVDALDTFSTRQGLEVNLSKTKVMAFNVLKATLDQTKISFYNSLIETTSSYTNLEVLYIGPRFSMSIAPPPQVRHGYVVVSTLE